MKRHPLLAFLLLLALFSGGFVAAARAAGAQAAWLGQFYMFSPALAAAATRLLFYEGGFRDAGLRLGRWRDYGAFWAVSLGVMALFYLLCTLAGAVSWDLSGDTFLARLASQMSLEGRDIHDLPEGFTPRTMLLIFLVGGLTVFNIPGTLMGFGEEFGWRGFLFPRLYAVRPWMGFVLGGAAWFAWHLPVMLILPDSMRPQLTPGSAAAYVATVLPASILAFTFFAYVYVRTGSIWVASFAHIVQNNAGMALSLVAPLDRENPSAQPLMNLCLLATMGVAVGVLYGTGRLAVFARSGITSGPSPGSTRTASPDRS